MKKVFISQPMNGLTDDQILAAREEAIKNIYDLYGSETMILDSFFGGSDITNPVACLARSIRIMSDADVVYFIDGWANARGCYIEHEICQRYGLEIYEEPSKR